MHIILDSAIVQGLSTAEQVKTECSDDELFACLSLACHRGRPLGRIQMCFQVSTIDDYTSLEISRDCGELHQDIDPVSFDPKIWLC
jgi:hypothetical protein